MFRPAKAGDWAAEEDDELSFKAPTPAEAAAMAAQKSSKPKSGSAAGSSASGNRSGSGDVRRDQRQQQPPSQHQQQRQPQQQQQSQHASRKEAPTSPKAPVQAAPPVANRWEKFRQQQQENPEQQHMEIEPTPAPVASSQWDRGNRSRDSDRGYGGRDSDRGGYAGRDSDRGGYGGRDSDRGFGGRDNGGRESDRGFGGGGRDRGSREFERGSSSRGPPPAPMTTERGVVVSIRDNFGFVSGVEREADLFFHISEAPVDVELQDEVEFKVKFNQRSDKDIAVQLVRLPKGSIVWEDIAEEFVEGVVTKGIPRSGSFHPNSNHNARDEPHGLIEVRVRAPDESEADDAVEKVKDEAEVEAGAEASAEAVATAPTMTKRNKLIRFTANSVASPSSTEPATDAAGEAKSGKKPHPPQFGDHVRFRVATHRKSSQKRAVDLTVTLSAKARLEKEIEAKLESMTRELGVVGRVKSGGGFLRCCDRTEDVYFPFHEIRESLNDDQTKSKGKLQLREGDEVSFYVYEDKDGADERSSQGNSRLTALRIVKVPTGTVSFEDVLRSDIEGVVTKIPKEPRNGPEVFGVINPTNPDDIVVISDDAATEPPQEKTSGGKKLKKKAAGVSFRLSDAQDVSYVPATGDMVVFDHVMDKRSRRIKASNVRVVQFNPKHRETGVITTVKDEFGFIKCADRSADAYFRFSDVMSVNNDFRPGTEVAFDVTGGGGAIDAGKGHGKDRENLRAQRVEILAPGTVKWETVLASDLEGEIISVPARQQKQQQPKPGTTTKPLQQKPHVGRVRVKLGDGSKHLVDFFPEFKEQLDATFLAAETSDDETASPSECKVEFPTSLSKYERAAIHAYCDWLGLSHASTGEGPTRRLTVTADARLTKEKLLELQQQQESSTTEIEFQADDAVDVRYNPRVGDQVKLNVVLVKRSKQLLSKGIVLLEAAVSTKTKANGTAAKSADQAAELPTGEGFIVTVKADGGFGFIQPADQGLTGAENLFFHIKDIVSGETQVADLKDGMEVQYRVSHDEKKKKTRAVQITVVPAGTVKKVEASYVRGVVHRPSLLQRFRKATARFGKNDKNKQQLSSAGRIRLTTADAGTTDVDAEGAAEDDDDADEEEDDKGNQEDEAKADADVEKADATDGGSETVDASASAPVKQDKKQPKKKPASSSSYVYYINDISDPAVVLRDGDEVEFVPHMTPKGLRALRVRLIHSHAKQGVVTKVSSDSGGVIRVDGDDAMEVGFTARNVLRGDMLGEGDRVEFALVKRPVEQKPTSKKKQKASATEPPSTADAPVADASETAQETTTAEDEVVAPLGGPEATSAFVATSVLCLVSSGSARSTRDSARPESRTVNSTLRQAMRQVGASAVAKSRMAKGPDGTRGFVVGWRSAAATGEVDADAAAVDPPQ